MAKRRYSRAVVKKYRITFEYKPDNRPWRKLTDWVYAETAREAIKLFKRGAPHIWPKKYRNIKAKSSSTRRAKSKRSRG